LGSGVLVVDDDPLLRQGLEVILELIQILFGFRKSLQDVVEGDVPSTLGLFVRTR
jgi:hypothetical protein